LRQLVSVIGDEGEKSSLSTPVMTKPLAKEVARHFVYPFPRVFALKINWRKSETRRL